MSPSVHIANAPVSFGVFELTANGEADLPPAEEVLRAVAGAGYAGIDLGPPGYLDTGSELRRRLGGCGLGLAGGWVELRFLDGAGFEDDLRSLDRALETFRAAPADGVPAPKPTLADAGSPGRKANPGHGGSMPELALSAGDWRRLASGVEAAAQACRRAGLEPTFHHHAGTHVESADEIERFLDATDVGLCLDTGHLLLGGGDPLEALGSWRERINHVHIKDVRLAALEGLISTRSSMREIWEAGVFGEFGTGDVHIDRFVAALVDGHYEGWIVVEQDRVLRPGEGIGAIAEEQARNLEYLRALGL